MGLHYYIILIAYLVVILIFFVLAFFNLYHAVKFGLFNRTAKIITALFIIISIGILAVTVLFMLDINWNEEFVFLDQVRSYIDPDYFSL